VDASHEFNFHLEALRQSHSALLLGPPMHGLSSSDATGSGMARLAAANIAIEHMRALEGPAAGSRQQQHLPVSHWHIDTCQAEIRNACRSHLPANVCPST
jgi:hypothetical protein